jgi:hypothetical protein
MQCLERTPLAFKPASAPRHYVTNSVILVVQAMVLGPVDTPGVAQLMQKAAAAAAAANSTDPAAAAAAAAAKRRRGFSEAPSAEVVATSMIKCIGKGGPVVTPYWGHVLQQQLMLGECLWPPALQRVVRRAVSRCVLQLLLLLRQQQLLTSCLPELLV